MKILKIIISFLISFELNAQVNPAVLRRDWYVGTYSGVLKDSAINSAWQPCSFKIYRFNEYSGPPSNDSAVVFVVSGASYVVCADSTIGNNRFCSSPTFSNFPYVYAKLKNDSALFYNYVSYGGNSCYSGSGFSSPGNWMMFRGKKTSNFTGIEEFSADKMVILYPNPISDILNIKTEHEIKEIEIYTIAGEKLNVINYCEYNSCKLNLSNLTNGMYFVNIRTTRGNITRKVIKMN